MGELGGNLVRDGLGCHAEPGGVRQVDAGVVEAEKIVALAPVSGGIVSILSLLRGA